MIDWLNFYWTMALCTGLLMLSVMLGHYRRLGSYRMILEMMDMGSHANGEDGSWFIRPDEDSAKRLIMLVILGAALFWPFSLVSFIAALKDL